MFARYSFIPQDHQAILTSVIRQNERVTAGALAALYEFAQKTLRGTAPESPQMFGSLMNVTGVNGGAKIATATDVPTGVYVQLVEAKGKLLLTVGLKWAFQYEDPTSSTVAAKVF